MSITKIKSRLSANFEMKSIILLQSKKQQLFIENKLDKVNILQKEIERKLYSYYNYI
jgi:hypothetical protein